MRKRQMSGNDVAISDEERWFKDGIDVNTIEIFDKHLWWTLLPYDSAQETIPFYRSSIQTNAEMKFVIQICFRRWRQAFVKW